MTITVTYSSIDYFRKTRKFKTLKGAQAFAQKWVGKHPELGSSYAVSFDGVGKVTCSGVTLAELFPEDPSPPAYRIHVSMKYGDYGVWGGPTGGFIKAFPTEQQAKDFIESGFVT